MDTYHVTLYIGLQHPITVYRTVLFTGEFQALQLVVLAVFGAVNSALASCMLVHFSENLFKIIVGL